VATQTVYFLCMSTKTISVRVDAYERLKRAKRSAAESFSDVIMRARWDAEPVTAGDYLRLLRERGPTYRPAELAALDEVERADQPPEDKWARG
jgi:hypothetical protein